MRKIFVLTFSLLILVQYAKAQHEWRIGIQSSIFKSRMYNYNDWHAPSCIIVPDKFKLIGGYNVGLNAEKSINKHFSVGLLANYATQLQNFSNSFYYSTDTFFRIFESKSSTKIKFQQAQLTANFRFKLHLNKHSTSYIYVSLNPTYTRLINFSFETRFEEGEKDRHYDLNTNSVYLVESENLVVNIKSTKDAYFYQSNLNAINFGFSTNTNYSKKYDELLGKGNLPYAKNLFGASLAFGWVYQLNDNWALDIGMFAHHDFTNNDANYDKLDPLLPNYYGGWGNYAIGNYHMFLSLDKKLSEKYPSRPATHNQRMGLSVGVHYIINRKNNQF